MKAEHVSLTAIMVAYMRGYHSTHDAQVLFDDTLAIQLIPEDRRNLIEQGLTRTVAQAQSAYGNHCNPTQISLSPILQTMGFPQIISRSQYAEEILQLEISKGVEQYVILGAGLDTFAFRHKEWLKELKAFEVDQPGTQEFKRTQLKNLGWEIHKHHHFVPADFT